VKRENLLKRMAIYRAARHARASLADLRFLALRAISWVMVQRPLLLLGTGSHVGKTTLVAGLCRMFANRGLKVAPFKAQNMSLNSVVTEDEEEIARSIDVQARAARQPANVHMNPILLKPKADSVSQLIVHGKALRDVGAQEYFQTDALTPLKQAAVRESLEYLKSHFDLIVAEGAGSCAEPNLRAHDVANFGLAELLEPRVFLIADIDKGGVFAEFLGTVEVIKRTRPNDLRFLEGFIINKFRGEESLLQPAIDFLESETGIPVRGTIPFLPEIQFMEEDRVRERIAENTEIEIAVVYLPHISNATDLDFLGDEEGVTVRYVANPNALGEPDAIIIPGTKNTTWDLLHLRRIGLADGILRRAKVVPIVGICGGYQMLGRFLHDEEKLESEIGSAPGLGLLDFEVRFEPKKTLCNRTFRPCPDNPFFDCGPIRGYEIHSGTVFHRNCSPMFVNDRSEEGAVDSGAFIFGTSVHDLFKNRNYTRAFINHLRHRKGLAPLAGELPDNSAVEGHYDYLARVLEERLHI
jgi:adenosylcobyric acid synthase